MQKLHISSNMIDLQLCVHYSSTIVVLWFTIIVQGIESKIQLSPYNLGQDRMVEYWSPCT